MDLGKGLSVHLPGDDDFLPTLVAHLARRYGHRVVEHVPFPEAQCRVVSCLRDVAVMTKLT